MRRDDWFDGAHTAEYRMKANELRQKLNDMQEFTWQDVVFASKIAEALGGLENITLFSEVQRRYHFAQKAKGGK